MSESSRIPISRPPFAGWPEGLSFGEGAGTVWYVPDGVVCVQTHCSRVDRETARAYLKAIRVVRDVEHESIARAGGLRFFQDFRSLQVFEREARTYLADQARGDFGRWKIESNRIELAPSNPIVRVTLQVVSQIVVQMGLPPFNISVDLAHELARADVRAPVDTDEHRVRHAGYARLCATA